MLNEEPVVEEDQDDGEDHGREMMLKMIDCEVGDQKNVVNSKI